MSFREFYSLYLSPEKKFAKKIKTLTGITPSNIGLYRLAFTHSSASSEIGANNERLELLGDAVLDLVVTDFLYQKYPYKGEGFLSELRSKIVSRSQLNQLGHKLGIAEFIETNLPGKSLQKSSTIGNATEALVGAIYIDKGFRRAKEFIESKVMTLYLDVEKIEQLTLNFKSKIINYAQKNNFLIEYRMIEEKQMEMGKLFTMGVFINGEEMGRGEEFNKKKAEQQASKQACMKVGVSVE